MQTSKTNDHIISHNPATHSPDTNLIQPKKPKIPLIILVVLGSLLIIIGAIWYSNDQSFNFSQEEKKEFAVAPIDETIIATVGAENIYGEDLNYKKSQSVSSTITPELEAELLDRLIDESIILQAGAEENYIELDGTVFNSALKNQQARQMLITQVTNKVKQEAAYKKGAIVSIWFMNDQPGPIGYEEGKKVALEKITAVHSSVIDGKMTIKQAGEALKSDTSLAQLDPTSYKINAYSEFDTSIDEQVSFDQQFNEDLLALSEGETTDVTVIQDHEFSEPELPKKDALYIFGQVTQIKDDGLEPFPNWLETQKTNYAINKN